MQPQFLISKPVIPSTLAHLTAQVLQQWENFCHTLNALNCEILEVPHCDHTSVNFPIATQGLIQKDGIMLGYHDTKDTQCSAYLSAWLAEHTQWQSQQRKWPALHPDHQRPQYFYGSADVLLTPDTLYFGYGHNGSAHANNSQLANQSGKRLVDLAIEKPAKHLIDCILIINEGQVLYQPDTLHPSSLQQITQDFSVTCTSDHPTALPTQSLIIGEHAICAESSFTTQQYLNSLGYEVHSLAFDALLALGIGPRALVLPCDTN